MASRSRAGIALVASFFPLAARAVTPDGIRGEIIKGIEAALETCQVKGYDIGGDDAPVSPVMQAEKAYYREFMDHGVKKRFLVGMFGRSEYYVGRMTYRIRYFMPPNGNAVGTIDDGGIEYATYSTPHQGMVAQLFRYDAVNPATLTRVRDYNGSCGGEPVWNIIQQNLAKPFVECATRLFGPAIVQAYCATRPGPWNPVEIAPR